MTATSVVLTAIHFKGIEQAKKEVRDLAEGCLCSESHIRNIINKVEKGKIVIK
jgi:MarR-like DNA-binding transcriptional regulator SgrR of sgrS sRNA